MNSLFKEKLEAFLTIYLSTEIGSKEREKAKKDLYKFLKKETSHDEKIYWHKKTHRKKRKLSTRTKKARAYKRYRKWFKKHRKECVLYQRKYRANRQYYFLKYYKEYREKNKEKIKKTKQDWYKKNIQHVHDYNKQYYIMRKARLNGFKDDF